MPIRTWASLDLGGVSGEQGLHGIGLGGLHIVIDPVSGNIHPGQLAILDNAVNLSDDDAVLEGGSFRDHGGLFGVVAGIQVAVAIGLVCGNQANLRRQIYVHSAVELQIGVDITDAQLSDLQHLRQAQALHTGKSKVQLFSDALGKQVQMIRLGIRRE